jgi:phosphatidylglycerophosphate synthase
LNTKLENRRPIKSRNSGWAKAAASLLARAGVSADAVSAGSAIFALGGGFAFVLGGGADGWRRAALLVLAAGCIQLRLVCNLLDGLVAVEHGKGGPDGPIWNELPDRFSDIFLLLGAGYGAARMGIGWAATAGWFAAAAAVLTAYVRELGRGLGLAADFSGPGAKPQRMAILTGAALLSAAEPEWGWNGPCLAAGVTIVGVLAAITVARRTLNLSRGLRARARS